MQEPKDVVGYIRVSTAEQAERGYSLEAQTQSMREYCEQKNWNLVDVYVDAGVSGKSMKNRLALKRLLAEAKDGKFKEVIVWKQTRIARNLFDLLTIVEHLGQYNVSLRSITENGIDTSTKEGRLQLKIAGMFSEYEREGIVENVKNGMKQRARMGQWNGGTVLGYRSKVLKEGSNRRERETVLEVVPEEARLVQKIFELYASGKGLKAIANMLNHQGYKTKKGNPFGVYGIAEILKNPVYIGKIRYNVRENWSEKRRKGTNKNPIIADGQHKPIISQELWDRVRALYAKKSGKSPRIFQGSFPLTGILRCPQCGIGMVAHRTKDKLKDGSVIYRRYYVCGAFQNKGSAVCKSNGIRAEQAEEAVFDRLLQAVVRPKVLRDVVDAINGRRSGAYKPLQAELKTIEKALDGVEAKKAKWYKLFESDGIEQEMLMNRLKDLQTEFDRLQTRQSELRAELGSQNVSHVPLAVVKTVLTKFHRLMEKSPPEQQKALLHMMVRRIEVKDRTVGSIEICLDERLQSSFLKEGPSGSPEGPFDYKGVLPLTITL